MKDKKSPNKSEYKVGLAFEKIGVKVEYQHPFGPYFLDVFLPKYNTCIEINGPHHVVKARQASDLIRQRYIEERGVNVYTISAEEANIEGEVNRLVKRVLLEAAQMTKPKQVNNFNDMREQLSQWVDKHGAPKRPAEPAAAPKKAPVKEDFATLLEQYLPEKSNTKNKR